MEEAFTFEFDRNSVETITTIWSEHSKREKSHYKTKNGINLFQGRGEGAVWQTPIPGGGGIFISPIILGNISPVQLKISLKVSHDYNINFLP